MPISQVVGYLDDDKNLHGSLIGGVAVYDPEKIVALSARLNVRTILLALPKIDRSRRNEILEQLRGARVAVRTVPDLNALAGGRAEFTDLQELDIEDLLGRTPVQPDQALLERNIRGRVVLVDRRGRINRQRTLPRTGSAEAGCIADPRPK